MYWIIFVDKKKSRWFITQAFIRVNIKRPCTCISFIVSVLHYFHGAQKCVFLKISTLFQLPSLWLLEESLHSCLHIFVWFIAFILLQSWIQWIMVELAWGFRTPFWCHKTHSIRRDLLYVYYTFTTSKHFQLFLILNACN